MSEPPHSSFNKTVLAASAAAVAAAAACFGGAAYLRGGPGVAVGALAGAASVLAVLVAAGGRVVLHRTRRAQANMPDLFLELNRSRSPMAVAAQPPRRHTIRRLLGRPVLGHDLLVG